MPHLIASKPKEKMNNVERTWKGILDNHTYKVSVETD